jgi:hypothetical protein
MIKNNKIMITKHQAIDLFFFAFFAAYIFTKLYCISTMIMHKAGLYA